MERIIYRLTTGAVYWDYGSLAEAMADYVNIVHFWKEHAKVIRICGGRRTMVIG